MGADGGTIPKRCELVKSKKKAEKVDKNVENASKWALCRLSQQPLRKPIVACRLGGLYNKEALIMALLEKKSDITISHIKNLKDIKEVKLCENEDYKESEVDKGDVYKDYNIAPFCCPLTSVPMNGNHAFSFNWRCGCVVSEKAMKELKSDVCNACGGSYTEEDCIVLNPPKELLAVYEERLIREMERKKHLKDANKDGKKSGKTEVEKSGVKRKMESTIQKDVKASEAYKSLFTTSEDAKKRPKAHWVTYNPLFN